MLNRIYFAIKYADDMQHSMFLLGIRQCDLHKRQMIVLSQLAKYVRLFARIWLIIHGINSVFSHTKLASSIFSHDL